VREIWLKGRGRQKRSGLFPFIPFPSLWMLTDEFRPPKRDGLRFLRRSGGMLCREAVGLHTRDTLPS